jgi:chromosomal replication initiation ATPase DnaA
MEESLSGIGVGFQGKQELTFDNFVTGDSNYVAFSAAKEVSESPGTRYNPLFIFCDVGQGKTHLLHAIGWDYLRMKPDGLVQLINGDEFSEELAEAPDRRALRERYSRCDILLVDDFHLLTDQARAEIVRLFEALHAGTGQLVLTSIRAPEELDLDDRLRSRIEGGLVCKILPPDMATRIAILRKKAEVAGVSIKEGVLEDIARKVTMNVRKLEGAVNRLVVLSKARDEMISADFAASALRDIMPEYPAEPALMYEAPAEGGESEFSDFVSDVAKTLARISPEPSEEAKLREAYAQKLYVWEMKGFVVDRLKSALDKKMDVLAREFVTFTSDVQRLIELQNKYGALNAKRFPEEAAVIEKLLFDPSAVEEVRRRIDNLEARLGAVPSDLVEDYTFEKFAVGPSNEDAFNAMKSVAESPFKGPTLILLWGGEGTGKSHLLNAVAREMSEKRSRLDVFLLHGDLFVEDLKVERGRHTRGKLRHRCAGADILLVDDVRVIFENRYATDEFMTVLEQRVLDGKKVVLVSDEPPEKTTSDPGFARLLGEGSTVHLKGPSLELKKSIVREYLSRKVVEFEEADVEQVAEGVGENLWVLMDGLDRIVSERRKKALVLEGTTILEDKSGYEPGTEVEEAVEEGPPEALIVPEELLPEEEVPIPEIADKVALEEVRVEEAPEAEEEIVEAEEVWVPTVPEMETAPPLEVTVGEEEVAGEPSEDAVVLSEEPESVSLPVEEAAPQVEALAEVEEEIWVPTPELPPSLDEEMPVVEEEAPPVSAGEETPVVEEEAPPVSAGEETPVVEEEAPPVSAGEETPVVEEEAPPVSAGEETPVVEEEAPPVSAGEEMPVAEEEAPPVRVTEEEKVAPSWEPGRKAPALGEIFESGSGVEEAVEEEIRVREVEPAEGALEEEPAGVGEAIEIVREKVEEPTAAPPPEPLELEEVTPAGETREEAAAAPAVVEPVVEEIVAPAEPPAVEEGLEVEHVAGPTEMLPAEELEPVGAEDIPLVGVGEEAQRAEDKGGPSPARSADEIIDTTWEIEGERLMEKI